MRIFFSQIELPGSGQGVDRLIQAFGKKYFNDNPNSCYKSDQTVVTFCYMLIKLQASLNGPEEERMTLEGFIQQAKGINEGEDLPLEELNAHYANMLNKPYFVNPKPQM